MREMITPLAGLRVVEIQNGNTEGEGVVGLSGRNVMNGYYKDERSSRRRFKDNVFVTDDVGRVDEDGVSIVFTFHFLYVTHVVFG